MKSVYGIWLPDEDTDLLRFAGGPGWRYQQRAMDAALEYVTDWSCAIDVGAHCGLWSMHLTSLFEKVYAFEPVSEFRECFVRNVTGATLFPYALGNKRQNVAMKIGTENSGDTSVEGFGNVEMRLLDEFDLNPGFIKLDCEGYEYFALRGAEQTLRRCKPVVCVEQRPGKAQKYGLKENQSVNYLRELGAKRRKRIVRDYILSWPTPMRVTIAQYINQLVKRRMRAT